MNILNIHQMLLKKHEEKKFNRKRHSSCRIHEPAIQQLLQKQLDSEYQVLLVHFSIIKSFYIQRYKILYKDAPTVLGVDLGTTYARVGIFKNGQVKIVANDQGNQMTPSYVAFTLDGEQLIGDAAKHQLTSNPENVVFDVKRLIGREFNDPIVQEEIKYFPFKVIEKNSKPIIQINTSRGEKVFTPEEISAVILKQMREIAETYLGEKITRAVITVPACFNNAQRQATIDAGTISGLNVIQIINEPTAATIFTCQLDANKYEKTILVFHFGGGTFDVSVVKHDRGVFEVCATTGNANLGGKDFDQRVMKYFIELFKNKTGKDIRTNNQAVQKLRCEVEKAKQILSSQHQTKIEIESLFDNEDFSETLTRAKFEELNMDLFNSIIKMVEQMFEDKSVKRSTIDEVVLVGSSTHIPKVQQLLKELFAHQELHVLSPSNLDTAVVNGCISQAGLLSGQKTGNIILLDGNPFDMNKYTSRLSTEEIDRMIQDSERSTDEDKKVKERINAKNELESYAYSLKTELNDKEKLGGQLSSDDNETIEKAVEEQIIWLKTNPDAEVHDLKEHKKQLEEIVIQIMTKLYGQGEKK